MNVKRDPDLLINAFLDEGLDELPDRSYDAVRSAIEQTRQRVVFGPWREPQMMNIAKLAFAAAAIVLVAAVGLRFLPGLITGPGATPSPTPLVTTVPTPLALPSSATALTPGRYVLRAASSTAIPISFEVPAGWWTQDSFVVSGGTVGDLYTPDLLFLPVRITAVNPDACQRMLGDWSLVSSADQIVEALMSQTGIFHTLGPDPAAFDLGDLHGRRIVFGGRESMGIPDTSDCTDGVLRSWADDLNKGQGGHTISEGQVVTLYVFDIDGTPLTLVAIRQGDSSPDDVAELDSIVNSVRIEP